MLKQARQHFSSFQQRNAKSVKKRVFKGRSANFLCCQTYNVTKPNVQKTENTDFAYPITNDFLPEGGETWEPRCGQMTVLINVLHLFDM